LPRFYALVVPRPTVYYSAIRNKRRIVLCMKNSGKGSFWVIWHVGKRRLVNQELRATLWTYPKLVDTRIHKNKNLLI